MKFNQYLNSFTVLLSSSVIVQAVFFLGTLILARLYSPSDYGQFGAIASIAILFSVGSGLRFDYLAFSRTSNNYRYADFYHLSIAVSVFLSLSLVALFFIFYGYEYKGVGSGSLFFLFLSYSIFYLSTQNILRTGDYVFFAKFKLAQAVLQILLSLIFFAIALDNGLLWGVLVAQTIVGACFLGRSICKQGVRIDNMFNIFLIWKIRAFINTITTILQYSTPFAPVFFGSIFYEVNEVGAYFIFSQLFSAPLSIFRRSLLSFLNVEFADFSKARLCFLSVSKVYVLFFIIICIVAILGCLLLFNSTGELLVGVIFGNVWKPYSYILAPLVVYFLLDALLQPFTTLAPLWGRERVTLIFEIARVLIVFVGGYFLISYLKVDFIGFVMFFTISMVFVYVVQLLYLIYLLSRKSYDFN